MDITMNQKLTHVTEEGQPTMVDVGDKAVTTRRAEALARLRFPQQVLKALNEQNWESAKGAVLDTSRGG
jgi:cyclic pyranopterin phosphate synthase